MKIFDTSGNELTERPDYSKGRLVQDPSNPENYIYTTWEELPSGEGNGETPKSKEQKLQDLDAQYDADKAELMKYFNEAVFVNDTALQEEIRQEMDEVNAKYIEDRKVIENEPDGSEE